MVRESRTAVFRNRRANYLTLLTPTTTPAPEEAILAMAESEQATPPVTPLAAPLSVTQDLAKDPVFLLMIVGQIESAEVRSKLVIHCVRVLCM